MSTEGLHERHPARLAREGAVPLGFGYWLKAGKVVADTYLPHVQRREADKAALYHGAERAPQPAAACPEKPEFLPDKFWNAENGTVRMTDIIQSWRALRAEIPAGGGGKKPPSLPPQSSLGDDGRDGGLPSAKAMPTGPCSTCINIASVNEGGTVSPSLTISFSACVPMASKSFSVNTPRCNSTASSEDTIAESIKRSNSPLSSAVLMALLLHLAGTKALQREAPAATSGVVGGLA